MGDCGWWVGEDEGRPLLWEESDILWDRDSAGDVVGEAMLREEMLRKVLLAGGGVAEGVAEGGVAEELVEEVLGRCCCCRIRALGRRSSTRRVYEDGARAQRQPGASLE